MLLARLSVRAVVTLARRAWVSVARVVQQPFWVDRERKAVGDARKQKGAQPVSVDGAPAAWVHVRDAWSVVAIP